MQSSFLPVGACHTARPPQDVVTLRESDDGFRNRGLLPMKAPGAARTGRPISTLRRLPGRQTPRWACAGSRDVLERQETGNESTPPGRGLEPASEDPLIMGIVTAALLGHQAKYDSRAPVRSDSRNPLRRKRARPVVLTTHAKPHRILRYRSGQPGLTLTECRLGARAASTPPGETVAGVQGCRIGLGSLPWETRGSRATAAGWRSFPP
jgi:hypothetical protein